jgi:putative ABC transport system substrate-binding protein
MKIPRRNFVMLLGGTAATWPLALRAQQPAGNLPRIGYLGATTPSSTPQRTAAFVQRLNDLGWHDGGTVRIEYRWAEGRDDRAVEFAAEFVQLKVDVIVTSGLPEILAAKRATSVIPIVFALASDPVGMGLVASLARPGGNVTGLSNLSADLSGKRLDLLRDVIPGLRRLAIAGNVGNPDSVREMRDVETAARTLGLDVVAPQIKRTEDIEPAFAAFKDRIEALYVVADPLMNTNRIRIQTLAMAAHLPTIYNTREFAEAGGLMSYGPDFSDLWRRAAEFVDKILRGAKPADIPVEQPTKFDLAINLITAKALGITVPPILLTRADEVIE